MSSGTGGAPSVKDAPKDLGCGTELLAVSHCSIHVWICILFFLRLPPFWEFILPITLYSSFSLDLVICNYCKCRSHIHVAQEESQEFLFVRPWANQPRGLSAPFKVRTCLDG